MEKITGSELVKRILNDPNGSIEKLIALAGGTETDWLEVKAATLPEYVIEKGTRRYLRKRDENDTDYAWNVAKAIVAMANTHGGVVILGIDDDFNAVGLEASDKKGDLAKGEDSFARCVLDNALRPEKRCWKCGKETYELTVSTHYELLEYQFADYENRRVAVIVVNPVPRGEALILVEEVRKSRETMLVRAIGYEGRVRSLYRRRDIDLCVENRDPRQESYALLYEQFLTTLPKSDSLELQEPQGLRKAIAHYHKLLQRLCAQDDRLFIQLDAEEDPAIQTEMELFEPMAEEYLSSELDWFDDVGDDTDSKKMEDDEEEADELDDVPPIPRKGGVFSLLEQEPRAMLLGEPGGGKTTCLKHLALRAANRYSDDHRVSLFVPLSRYKGPGDLFPLMVRATRSSKIDTGLTLGHLEWLMKQGSLQLLLDALNECPTEYTRHCVQDIQSCLNRHPSIPITISSRTYAYREQIGLPAFTVQPMDVEQRQAFLAVHLRSEDRAKEIMGQLREQPGGEILASNPLLLRLVVEAIRGGQPLPPGRARLYRQFLERWYSRESNKARNAGEPLSWSKDQTLSALSQLAFNARLAGLRSVHRNQAVKFLHDIVPDPMAFIDRMAQGLVLTCDFEDIIDFLHETFQEYLAAEFLLQHPESVRSIEKNQNEKWGMILAYAIELDPIPPLSLLEGMAKLDPWIAACAENAHDILKTNQEMHPLCYAFIESQNDTGTNRLNWPGKTHVREILTPGLSYLIELLSGANTRWTKMTARFLKELGSQRSVEIFLCMARLQWPGIHAHQQAIVLSVNNAFTATNLIKTGFAKPEDFKDRIAKWSNSADPVQAIRLVEAGIAKLSDVIISIEQAIRIVEAGLAKPKDLKNSIPKWVSSADLIEAIGLVEAGFAKPKDFRNRIPKWIRSANGIEAIGLVEAGFAKPKDFGRRIGVAKPKDFRGRIPKCASSVTPNQAIQLVQAGIAKPEDFRNRIPKWAESIGHKQTNQLVEIGIAKPKDFRVGIPKWVSSASPKRAIQLVQAGIAKPKDFRVSIPRWVSSAGPKQAIQLVRAGIAKPEDFRDRIPKWVSSAGPKLTKKLRKAGFSKLFESAIDKPFIDQTAKNDLTSKTTPKDFRNVDQVIGLLKAGIAEPKDLYDIPKWADSIGPKQANQLIEVGIAKPKDFRISISKWVSSAGPEEAIQLAEAGIAEPEDFKDRVPEWVKSVDPKMARKLLKAGFSELSNFVIDKAALDQTAKNDQTSKTATVISTKLNSSREKRKVLNGQLRKKSKIIPPSAIPSRPKDGSQIAPPLPEQPFDFGRNSTEFTVYIDEAWPGTIPNAGKPASEGVIAGMVCYGRPEPKSSAILPRILTHLYKDPENAKSALFDLLKNDRVFPFIFPISLADFEDQAVRHYKKLFQHAIRLLLGWVLQGRDVRTRVHVIAERISGHDPGHDQTEYFRGLLHHTRYERWIIDEVRWEDKNFGYLPYADLLAHLTHEHTDVNRNLGRKVRYKTLPGYIPLSLKLIPMLERVEHLESIGNVEDALDLLIETGGTRFGKLIQKDLQRRIQAMESLQEKLLLEMENRYQSKSRNLSELRRLFLFMKSCMGIMPEDASVRIRLIWMLLAFQDANHDGDPQRVQSALGDYYRLRGSSVECDLELTAYTDLNMAVHFADRFEFAEAEATVRQWIGSPLFSALSARQRGRMYSSLGQFRAMQLDHEGADHFFGKALEYFENPALTPTEKAEECDQTLVYRAINALDVGFTSALTSVEAVLGNLTQAGERLASTDDPRTFYHHHLLVRSLYQHPRDTTRAREVYLKMRPQWIGDIFQHPWPLIDLYRGLLLYEHEETHDEDFEWFGKAIACCDIKQHGGTLKLIGAMIATVASCCFEEEAFTEKALEWLNEIQDQLSVAGSNITGLREILKEPSPERIDAALRLLPFNYH